MTRKFVSVIQIPESQTRNSAFYFLNLSKPFLAHVESTMCLNNRFLCIFPVRRKHLDEMWVTEKHTGVVLSLDPMKSSTLLETVLMKWELKLVNKV